ncbi:MAG: NAD(P)/FAD-dependent oxidoreductase [Rhodospirillales bacterium]|nr:NAD(P)/FAD-dependent oxidoreductase [Rhodospirillales bacterium]
MQDYDVIIIGAGAAGLMCAGEAVKRGRNVLLLERAKAPGQKIRISGGGRANFTNIHTGPDNFLSDNPRFCISALKGYSQHDFTALVEKHGIAYNQRGLGQLFCNGPAQQITDMLLAEAIGAELRVSIDVTKIRKIGDEFTVETDGGSFKSAALVIATGGPSIPKMGSSRFAYKIAKQFGLKVIEPRPGLVPLTFDAEMLAKLEGLSGVSVDAKAKLGKIEFTEALLFTHRGLSGPVILQISSYWHAGDEIILNLLPDIDLFAHLKSAKQAQPKREVQTALSEILPKQLAVKMAEWAMCDGRLADLPDKKLRALADHITAWRVTPNGTEGERTAEVTIGGIDTKELSSKTMEVGSVPGLYFIGEAVDVTGHLGGFNFQWAWASGYAAGQAV